jgi:phenylacetate-CoA ligase
MLRPTLWKLRCCALGPSARFLRVLEREQSSSEAEARAIQTQRLERLLLHAHATVPYYNRALERCGVVHNGGIDLSRFSAILPLERQQIQNRDLDLVSSAADRSATTWYASGGSTGVPAQVLLDRDTSAWFLAVQFLFDSWTGYRPGQRRALLWGSDRDLGGQREKFRTRLGRWLRNETVMNAFRMDFERMRCYLRMLDELQPALLVGYADCLAELARLAVREHFSVRIPGAVISAAGTLYPEMRDVIQRVFHAPIFDRYGCREVGDVACEDRSHSGLAVCGTTHYVEIVRPDGSPCDPGETGELLITLLVNYSMPIVRYRIGDLAAWAPAPNGHHAKHPWPVLQHIAGRTSDVVVRRGGVVSPTLFAHNVGVVLNDGWVHKYQVVQETLDEFRILIVPGDGDLRPSTHEAQLERVLNRLRDGLGCDSRVRIELVPAIEPSPSGKHRWLLSKVPAVTSIPAGSSK